MTGSQTAPPMSWAPTISSSAMTGIPSRRPGITSPRNGDWAAGTAPSGPDGGELEATAPAPSGCDAVATGLDVGRSLDPSRGEALVEAVGVGVSPGSDGRTLGTGNDGRTVGSGSDGSGSVGSGVGVGR